MESLVFTYDATGDLQNCASGDFPFTSNTSKNFLEITAMEKIRLCSNFICGMLCIEYRCQGFGGDLKSQNVFYFHFCFVQYYLKISMSWPRFRFLALDDAQVYHGTSLVNDFLRFSTILDTKIRRHSLI